MGSSFLLAQVGGGSGYQTVIFLVLMFGILYFLIIRPQQKQLKDHRNLVGALKKGDEVATQGGLIGKIHAVLDKTILLEIAPSVRIQVLKSAITGKTSLSEDAASPSPKPEEKK